MDRRIEQWCSYNVAARSFHTKKLDCRLFRQKLKNSKHSKIAFLCHPFGDLGVTYTVHPWLVGKRGRLHVSANWTFFASSHRLLSPALTVEALWADIGQNCGFWKGWVNLSANVRGKRESSTNGFWRQKTGVPALSRGVVCVILNLAVLIQYRRVTHWHTMMANTRASLAPRG